MTIVAYFMCGTGGFLVGIAVDREMPWLAAVGTLLVLSAGMVLG